MADDLSVAGVARRTRRSVLGVVLAAWIGLLLGQSPAIAGPAVTAKAVAALVDVNADLAYLDAATAGTGMVLGSKGWVLTNNHVIRGAKSIQVRDVGNGRTYLATVAGYDIGADVAVLQLSGATGLQTVPVARSGSVRVGEQVIAVGNARGVGGTPRATAGTLLAVGASITASDELAGTIERLTGLLETNARLEPGDSGGALVDATGQIIGMLTAASSGFALQQGGDVGYAVPIATATAIASKVEHGTFTNGVHSGATAFLGVEAENGGSRSGDRYIAGALVQRTVAGSPAAKAGLEPGDVIDRISSQSVVSLSSLTTALLRARPGQRIALSWVDSYGSLHTTTVILTSGPPQ